MEHARASLHDARILASFHDTAEKEREEKRRVRPHLASRAPPMRGMIFGRREESPSRCDMIDARPMRHGMRFLRRPCRELLKARRDARATSIARRRRNISLVSRRRDEMFFPAVDDVPSFCATTYCRRRTHVIEAIYYHMMPRFHFFDFFTYWLYFSTFISREHYFAQYTYIRHE